MSLFLTNSGASLVLANGGVPVMDLFPVAFVWDAVVGATSYVLQVGSATTLSDVYNTACTASETASTDATFPGLASPSTNLPSSMYLSARPSWWDTDVPWPPIGPDITGGDITNTGGHANKIPAQRCYETTAKDANGFLTAFDADACNEILAPTGLTVR